MQVRWVKYESGEWCKLETVNLEQSHFDEMSGIYVIWRGIPNRKYLYVGQGEIKQRLYYHLGQFMQKGIDMSKIYVTWASVHDEYKDGIESYLAYTLLPSMGKHHPRKPPIPVNLPF